MCVTGLQAGGAAGADALANGESLRRGGLYGKSGPLAAPPARTADLEVPVEGFGRELFFSKPAPQNPPPGFPVAFQMEAVSFLLPCVL